jgi:hypothetical protein
MGRLKAPARDEPRIDQHQRRAPRQYLREIGSDIKQCSAAGRLRVRSAVFESLGADRERSSQKSVLNSLFRSRISSDVHESLSCIES